jgi:hypothetical protein
MQVCDGYCDCQNCDDEEPSLLVEIRAADSDNEMRPRQMMCAQKYSDILGFAGDIDCAAATASPPTSTMCTCINRQLIPMEWRCDGYSDCPLSEDEQDCGELWALRAQHIFGPFTDAENNRLQTGIWGVPTVVRAGMTNCADRLAFDVLGIGQSAGLEYCATLIGSGTCSPACARLYVDWKLDCNATVPEAVAGGATRLFECCSRAMRSGSTASCANSGGTTDYDSVPSCDGQGSAVQLWRLGDGICDFELQCARHAYDAGDCEQSASTSFNIVVSGAVSEEAFKEAFGRTVLEANPEAGLDEGLLSFCLPILVYMENPHMDNR